MTNETADMFQSTFGYKDGVMQKYFAPVVGKDVFFHVLSLNLPKSVGQVKLRSNNPRQRLSIDPNYLDNKQDVQAVMEGILQFQLSVKYGPNTSTYSRCKVCVEDV